MRTRDRVSQVILILAALLAAARVIMNLREVWEPFSGAGIGAVSVGFFDVPVVLLAVVVVGLIPFNRRVAAAARRHSLLADRFRRAYLWMMLVYAIWAVVSLAWITLTQGQGITTFYVTIMGAYIVAATFLPLQAFFAAAAVAFVIGNPTVRR